MGLSQMCRRNALSQTKLKSVRSSNSNGCKNCSCKGVSTRITVTIGNPTNLSVCWLKVHIFFIINKMGSSPIVIYYHKIVRNSILITRLILTTMKHLEWMVKISFFYHFLTILFTFHFFSILPFPVSFPALLYHIVIRNTVYHLSIQFTLSSLVNLPMFFSGSAIVSLVEVISCFSCFWASEIINGTKYKLN